MRKQAYKITSRGVQLFKNRLAKARWAHQKICDERTVAHELSGDGWHDNPYFNYLQQMEANKTWRINEIENILSNAKRIVVEEGARPTFQVDIGSVVLVEVIDENNEDGEEDLRLIEIVGFEESVPDLGMISYTAPFAAALLGMSEGESKETVLPQGKVILDIVELFATHPDMEEESQTDIVSLGVTVEYRINGQEAQTHVVKNASNAIASAILGMREGDVLDAFVNGEEVKVEIIRVQRKIATVA